MASLMCGVDEAGRGPWAGPVYAAAVILDESRPIPNLADCKLLTPKKRESLAKLITERARAYCIAWSEVEEIDRLNIREASLLAMAHAVMGLSLAPHKVMVDGRDLPNISYTAEAIIGGDQIIPAISAASILAKVARDELMMQKHKEFPHYGFDRHKGYGTSLHRQQLLRFGPCAIHRRSFRPVRESLFHESSELRATGGD